MLTIKTLSVSFAAIILGALFASSATAQDSAENQALKKQVAELQHELARTRARSHQQLAGLEQEKAILQHRLKQVEQDTKSLQTRFEEEVAARRTQLDQLRKQSEQLRQMMESLRVTERELSKETGKLVETNKSQQENLRKLVAEVAALRADATKTKELSDKRFAEVVRLTDLLHDRHGDLLRLKEHNDQLVRDLKVYKTIVEDAGLSPPSAEQTVHSIEVQVTELTKNMIELSFNKDDKLRVDSEVDVFHDRRHIGAAKIIAIEDDRAIIQFLRGASRALNKDDRLTLKSSSKK